MGEKYDIIYVVNTGSGDVAGEIIEATNGDLIFTITFYEDGAPDVDILLGRMDKDGVIMWMQVLGANNEANDRATSVIETSGGDIVLCGFTSEFSAPLLDQAVVARFRVMELFCGAITMGLKT